MRIIARAAPAGLACDLDTKVTSALADALWALGYRVIFRYVPLPGNNDPKDDIDRLELEMLLRKGFGVGLVQHPRDPKWFHLPGLDGSVDAGHACVYAQSIGYPSGAHLFQDLEGITGSPADVTVFANEWAYEVIGVGFLAGCYHGFEAELDSVGLYALHWTTCYWTDLANRPVAQRGNAVIQKPTIKVLGFEIDPDEIVADKLGETPYVAFDADTDLAA